MITDRHTPKPLPYNMTQPFIYAIGWTKLDRYYLGIRYKRGCAPSDLWTVYFTSSKTVAEFRKEHGEPDHLEILYLGETEDVQATEASLIREYNLHSDERWLNRGCFKTVSKTPEQLAEFSEMLRQLWKDPVHRAKRLEAIRKAQQLPEYKAAISTKSKANWVSAEYREKHAASRAVTTSDPEWRKGQSERSKEVNNRPEVKAKVGAAWKGRKRSPESVRKSADSRRGAKRSEEARQRMRDAKARNRDAR